MVDSSLKLTLNAPYYHPRQNTLILKETYQNIVHVIEISVKCLFEITHNNEVMNCLGYAEQQSQRADDLKNCAVRNL